MKQKWVYMYLDIAKRISQESHAVRLKVGAVFVSLDGVMSTGINGLPAGGSNVCEYETNEFDSNTFQYKFATRPEVSHAEEAVFAKLMLQGVSTKNGSMFITHTPCIHCAKIMVGAGIKYVFYSNDYRSNDGVEWLKKNGVIVEKVS